jgi:ATP-binding cassette subfamily B protein
MELKHLNKYFYKYKGRLLLGLLFIIAGDILGVYAPSVVREGIDFLVDVMGNDSSTQISMPESMQFINRWLPLNTGDNWKGSLLLVGVTLAILYLVIYVVKGIFLFLQRQALIVMSRYVEFDLKNEIFCKYLELDLGFYKSQRTGDLMNRISEDVGRVRMYVGPAVMYIMNLIVLFVMCITVMLSIHRELALYTLAPLPFMMWAIYIVSKKIHQQSERVQEQQSKLSSIVQETASGIRILKSFRKENYFGQFFNAESDKYKNLQLQQVRIDALFMPVIMLLVGLSSLLTIAIGVYKVQTGEITPGVVVQFVFYVNILTWPFAVVGWVSSLVIKAEASMKRINEFLQTRPKIENLPGAIPYHPDSIVLKNVSYRYPNSNSHTLHNINMTLERGKSIGIIGRTGSGKTTLAQLILRQLDPTDGAVLNGKNDLKKIDIYSFRDRSGYVSQDVFLFSDTIAANIAFGSDTQDETSIRNAAKDAVVLKDIESFPEGFNTLLGERGINLSGGQKQRVSIARALIKKPDLLVFDDCLSAVDTETESLILQSLSANNHHCIKVFISHRIQTIQHCDIIYVLDQGKIIEEGNHSSLMNIGGVYRTMFDQQQVLV